MCKGEYSWRMQGGSEERGSNKACRGGIDGSFGYVAVDGRAAAGVWVGE